MAGACLAEQIKDAGSKACFARETSEDAEMRSARGVPVI